MSDGSLLDREYLETPEQWDAIAALCRARGTMGLDTEYYGNVDGKSTVGRARVHVWSVAVPTDERDPLGFCRARGWCLPALALEHPALRELLEDATVTKAVHNQPVDDHALANHGIQLRGAINTLGLVRWMMPGLINTPGRFALKPLMVKLLRREPVATFKDVVGWEGTEPYSTFRNEARSACSCGMPGCRKRKPELGLEGEPGVVWDIDADIAFPDGWVLRHEKTRVVERIETVRERKISGEYPLETIVPGHERWGLLVRYAIDDAVSALQVLDLCGDVDEPAPFPYDLERPGYSQAVEDAIIEMERNGFPVDVPWCAAMTEKAQRDEARELEWLARWWRVNAPDERKEEAREEVDAVWSSPTKKIALFDEMGFPRSPIWAKGRVKRGEVKMDHAAMAWIAANCPEAKQLCEHLLHLQRIRSGMKYLVKLRDSGGWVHPVCGPGDDDDDRSGAVTGRLGVKGELEAQQLPKEGVKDLYQVRRAIVANRVEANAGAT